MRVNKSTSKAIRSNIFSPRRGSSARYRDRIRRIGTGTTVASSITASLEESMSYELGKIFLSAGLILAPITAGCPPGAWLSQRIPAEDAG